MNPTRLDEISKILDTSRDVKSFYRQFLALSANMSSAQVGVAWQGTKAPFQPLCQVQLKSNAVPQLPVSEQRHNELLERAASSERSFIVLPGPEATDQPALMFGRIEREQATEVVEFLLPAGNSETHHRQVVSQLDEYCAVAKSFRETDATTARSRVPAITTAKLDEYLHHIHGSLDDRETASRVANETRQLLDCDRVSVLFRCRGKWKIVSISGQPSVNTRSDTVAALQKLAAATLKTGQSFWYPDDNGSVPPQMETPLNDYLNVAATRSMVILPVFDRPPTDSADSEKSPRTQKNARPIAGIVIEACQQQWDRSVVAGAIETADRHASDAIRNALQHRSLFLYPLWKWLGSSRSIVAARNLPKTLLALAALAVVTAALCFIPAPFTLHCKGTLQPEIRANIFAGEAGRVDELRVSHGTQVTAGQTLLRLENEDIEIELENVESEIQRQSSRLETNRMVRSRDRESDRQATMEDNIKSIEAILETLERRREILRSKAEKLNVTSRIDGQVLSFDIEDRLDDRPVRPEERLLEVADVSGPWQLRLQLPDRRVGHLLTALDSAADEDAKLKVTYQLAGEPGKTFTGHVREYSRAAEITADRQQVVTVIVDVDEKDIADYLQADGGVSAKIYCGTQPLGYVWLHDIYEFVQAKVLFSIW